MKKLLDKCSIFFPGLDRRKRVRRNLSENRLIITQHFTERTVTPGGDISMQCAASSDRPPQFTWERDGVTISSNTDPRYALGQVMTSDNSVVTQLNITRVRVEDGGLYSCTAKEGDNVATHENRLDVYGPPYIRSLPPIKVQSGEAVNLRCPFYGYPISKIDWDFKGKIINSNNLFQTRYKRGTVKKYKTRRNVVNIHGVLTIPEVSKEQNGAVYTCIVTSPSGEMARRAFEIQVIEAPILEDLLLGNNLQEGQIVNIYCNVRSGDLPIHFEWLKDGKRISSNLKVVERSSELFSALVIKKVSLEHCGTYTCVASNHVAKVNRSTELYIKVAPKWAEEPSNSSLLLGRRGTVSCSANGYPQPQVHWMKKDALLGTWQPVLELAGGGILSLPNGTLIIEEVSLTDEGLYSCNVENGVGSPLSKTIWMSVNKPVHFESTSTNVTSRLGHPVTLECKALGDDPIRILWTHNGNILDFQIHSAWQNQTSLHTELYLQALMKYTNYTVKVAGYSNYGPGPFSYPIVCATLQDVPDPPADIKVLVLSPTSLLVSWKRPEHPNGELLYYTVYVKPTSSNGPAQTNRVEAEGRTVAELKELTTGRTYETWLTASTGAGEGPPTRRVSHTPSQRVVAGVASLGGLVSVGVGSSLLLSCACVGSPPPRTVWYHNHNIITHHPRFTRNHDDSLLINNIDQSLGGNYTCLAKNLYGSDSVEYVVTVLPLPDAPVLRATPYKDSILVDWEQPYFSLGNKSQSQKISYSLTWKEASGPWQEAWPANKLPNLSGVQKHALTGLKCGTKYSLRITATNKVGTSQPAYIDVSTLGGAPIPPSTNEWLWSNCSHMFVQLAGWDDAGCELRSWDLEYRPLGTRNWIRAHNTLTYTNPSWSVYQSNSPSYRTGSFAISDLSPGTWYQVRVTATNEAGSVTTTYNFATKNEDGKLYEISPYAQFAVGFRTFGHVENQDLPCRQNKLRYDTETSFQLCSESEDSDSISKSTLKSMPRSKFYKIF
ncbi:Down syndrome cell adhesion molecule-like protein CG42256 [Papilio machaon]|uniref:Down syndrome cell adhesion molecule-like protein CG42256 n=1 Tax=Papilio machaon TaxID=76193 RepID=A0A0N1IG41_PAPMA|nr:Down syndrome cell adhesion molecule-like protein CG42256 [Papilio machaon]